VSLNAMRHGLLSMHSVANLEKDDNFTIVVQDHVDYFQPTSGVHEGLIEEMASAYWRTHRLWAMETNMMNRAIAQTSPTGQPVNGITDAFLSWPTLPVTTGPSKPT